MFGVDRKKQKNGFENTYFVLRIQQYNKKHSNPVFAPLCAVKLNADWNG